MRAGLGPLNCKKITINLIKNNFFNLVFFKTGYIDAKKMSQAHSQQAQARGQAGAQQVQTSEDGDLFQTVRVGNFNLRRSQNVFLNRSHRVQVFNSSTLPADALANADSSRIFVFKELTLV